MSDRTEGAILVAVFAICAVVYMGCGAILAHLLGITESTLAWWGMVIAWPAVLIVLACIAWAVLTISYGIVAIIARAAGSR